MTAMLSLGLGLPGLSCRGWPRLVSTAAAAPTKKTARLNPALSKVYTKAQDLFDEKKFEAALEASNQIAAKQPDFAPAKLLQARSLYQLRRYAEAFKIFQQIDSEFFDPPSHYDAGQTAYSLNNFPAATGFFELVPEGHPLYDMAGYYGGIAAFKTGDYASAIDLLEQAVVLPSKLVRSQQAYLREAERLESQKQKAAAAGTKTPAASAEKSPSLALPAPALEDGNSDRSYRFLRPVRSIALLPRTKLQKQESSAGKINEYAINAAEIQLKMGISHEDSARSPHYVLQAQTSFWGVQGSSNEIPLFWEPRREQEYYIIQHAAPKTVSFIEGEAGVEWPLLDNHTLGVQLGVYSHVPNHYEVGNLFSPWAGSFYAYRSSLVEAQLSAGFHARFEDEKQLFFTSQEAASLSFKLPANFRINADGELLQYVYQNDEVENPIDGPEFTLRGSGEFGYQQDGFLALFVGGVFESSQKMRLHERADEASSLIEFDSSVQGLRARGELSVFKWLRLGGSWLDVQRKAAGLQGSEALLGTLFIPSISETSAYVLLFDNF